MRPDRQPTLPYLLPYWSGRRTVERRTPARPLTLPYLLTYFPPAPPGSGEEGEGGCTPTGPTLHPDVYHGLFGEAVKAVAPHTEAEPAAILLVTLTAFGSAAGLGPHFDHGKPHGSNLFVGLVGPTSGKKGTATGIGLWLVGEADPEWRNHRVHRQGFGSGEGLVWAVRDPRDGTGGPPDPGVTDKRLLVVEEEWAKGFALAASESSILSPVIRSAFDRAAVGKANKGENAYGCRRPHISIVANITPQEFAKCLNGKHAGSIANGFVNRFLLCWTDRVRFLPRGGDWPEALRPFVSATADALAYARGVGRLALDDEAGRLWDSEYRRLEAHPDDLFGMATARASDLVMKLALVYALADKADAIRLPHLRAALACWAYCEATAKRLFVPADAVGRGQQQTATASTPDPLWLLLLRLIRAEPGMRRSELTAKLKNTAKADAIGHALDELEARSLAYRTDERTDGRAAERWYPGSQEGNNSPPPSSPGWTVQADDREESKKLSKEGDDANVSDNREESKKVSKEAPPAEPPPYLLTYRPSGGVEVGGEGGCRLWDYSDPGRGLAPGEEIPGEVFYELLKRIRVEP